MKKVTKNSVNFLKISYPRKLFNLHIVTSQSSDVPRLYEGDMALTDEQAQILGKIPTQSGNNSRDQEAHTRGAIRNPAQLWPDGIIPFEISSRIGIAFYF